MENVVTLDLYEYNDIYADSLETIRLQVENEKLKEEIELLKARKVDLPDEVELMGTPYGQYVVINRKQIKVKGGNIQLCNKKEDTPTYTVKIDSSEVYEAVKKAADEFKEEQKKYCNKQNYMICNYLKDGVVFVTEHIIVANRKDMKQMKEKFNEIDWVEINL
ncbi:hypothetical protein EVU91_04435 [Macrococcoides bohemicum]|uniref:hypothetical protein n=1 Tax=Macrococcoides bohemicum TaxID=1903056 RepID=UPI001059FE86|nr:hypothetical protein [Macrococcus bohemicus]TDL39397.1 hypothetical protein EVU91_04435 [Macrococcus bohemicus]